MRLKELERPIYINSVEKYMDSIGWTKAGSGNFATVFTKPGKTYALKVFDSRDYGYLRYLKIIQNVHNKHFPKTFGKIVKISHRFNAIRIEPLKKYDTSKNDTVYMAQSVIFWGIKECEKFKMGLGEFFDKISKNDLTGIESLTDNEVKTQILEEHQDFIKKNKDFIDALTTIHDRLVGENYWYQWDLKYSNFMERPDGTIVITDPIV